jgi:hypothetical protein
MAADGAVAEGEWRRLPHSAWQHLGRHGFVQKLTTTTGTGAGTRAPSTGYYRWECRYISKYGFDACDGFGTVWGRAARALRARVTNP